MRTSNGWSGTLAPRFRRRLALAICRLLPFKRHGCTSSLCSPSPAVRICSFELYRRNISPPEIITFDELYERAKFIVEHVED
jgi:hypothetical protein